MRTAGKKIIYMDNAATTPLAKEALEAMLPFLAEEYGNASSLHSLGQRANLALRKSRETIARVIGAQAKDIFFTSGGTEADNWAVRMGAEAGAARYERAAGAAPGGTPSECRGHIITTRIEHHAVLRTCGDMEKRGFDVTYLAPDAEGFISPESVEAALRPDTVLISVMTANNEVGTIQPVGEIGRIAREHGVFFHTDAVQAFGHIPLNVDELQADLLSASAHKVNGPKGVGFLYMRRGAVLPPWSTGGMQESGRRAGTENIAGIVGFAKAAELAESRLLLSADGGSGRDDGARGSSSGNSTGEKAGDLISLRDHIIGRVLAEVAGATLNGSRTRRLPNNVNFCFENVDAKSLVLALNREGICASAASACDSGDLNPSHVLLAMGVPYARAAGSLRLSLGEENTREEADHVVECLKKIVGAADPEAPAAASAGACAPEEAGGRSGGQEDGRKPRALIAMSGGVDSSVSAILMREAGFDCVGATMKLYVGGDELARAAKSCCGSEDAEIAAQAAAELGIPHYVFDYQKEFARRVIDPFVRSYLAGATPNPCIECNRFLKFDLLLARAEELDCAKIATGHYARIGRNAETGRWELRRGADLSKDQSYVLYMLTQEQLARIDLPLGRYTKQQVRGIARAHGLVNAEKGESQDICFVPDGQYKEFVRQRAEDGAALRPGNIVDACGRVLGTHQGLIGYTIGQRKGLGLPSTEPWYVTEIRPESNEIVVGRREAAFGRELTAGNFNWLSIAAPARPFRAMAKIRYRHEAAPAEITPLADGRVRIVFDEPQWAVTKGQAAVLYDGDLVLGGGTIL